MSKHEKQNENPYDGNGYDPNRPIPAKDPGGKHGKPDTDDKDNDDKDQK